MAISELNSKPLSRVNYKCELLTCLTYQAKKKKYKPHTVTREVLFFVIIIWIVELNKGNQVSQTHESITIIKGNKYYTREEGTCEHGPDVNITIFQ